MTFNETIVAQGNLKVSYKDGSFDTYPNAKAVKRCDNVVDATDGVLWVLDITDGRPLDWTPLEQVVSVDVVTEEEEVVENTTTEEQA